ncbi:MAG: DNA photolyase family protein [Flavobacteriales bacterium]|nr:DNA photolyase family protein [Flavobacteriales bacterium]
MRTPSPDAFFWFRRDLRLEDNAALYTALSRHQHVQPVFIFDSGILSKLQDRDDARVTFIWRQLQSIDEKLRKLGSTLWVWYGDPVTFWTERAREYPSIQVYAGQDFEPGYPLERDKRVQEILKAFGGALHLVPDHVLVPPGEILQPNGQPYTVYTPFSKQWLSRITEERLKEFPSEQLLNQVAKGPSRFALPPLKELGFSESTVEFSASEVTDKTLKDYHKNRNFPALVGGTSRLSVHLRFGTISVRQLARRACSLSETFLKELGWREFFMHVLYHFPHTVERAFRSEYDRIAWRNDPEEFERWCLGLTGFPLVDAGMRELNTTGFMHNRVRMVVASFLTKDLLIDWRWGERYFARRLLDFELASNVGNWQWAAGTGCDAAPYFRIFNPTLQMEKFDPLGEYVRRWVPEWGTKDYPAPMVDHEAAKKRALEAYQKARRGE